MAVPSLRFGSFGGCRVSWFRICGFLGVWGVFLDPPTTLYSAPTFKYPLLRTIRAPLKGPWGGPGFGPLDLRLSS